MGWRNGPDSFGLASRLMHWGTAGLVLGQMALGLRLSGMPPALDTIWLYGLHKTLGVCVLAAVLARLVWHRISPPPPPLGPPGPARTAARVAHAALYALLIASPLAGWVASSASGIDTVIFGHIVLPSIAPVSEVWEARAFAVHGALAASLAGLVALHMMAALKREMEGDGTLTRMLRGRV